MSNLLFKIIFRKIYIMLTLTSQTIKYYIDLSRNSCYNQNNLREVLLMLEKINFFSSKLDIILISILTIVNIVLIIKYDIKNRNKEDKIEDKNLRSKFICTITWLLIIIGLFFYILYCTLGYSFMMFAIYLIVVIVVFYCWHKQDIKLLSPILSDNEIHLYLMAGAAYISIFSSYIIDKINILTLNIDGYILETFLIIYFLVRIIIFSFSMLSNLILIINLILQKLNLKTINLDYKLVDYYLYDPECKNIFIYFLKSPYIIFKNIYNICKIKFKRCCRNLKAKIINFIININKRRNFYTIKIIYVSIIIAIVITYIIVELNKSIFSDEIISIYELIATVLLIPIISNEISNIAKKLKRKIVK